MYTIPIIGKLSDWTITDNGDGTKKLERVYSNGGKITIDRALIHEELQAIEPLQVLDIMRLNPYSIV